MDTPEVTAAAAIGGLKPETFLSHYRDIRDFMEEHGGAGTAVARAKKAAKRDGIDLDVLKLVQKFADKDDDEVATFIHKLRTYCGWLKMPLGAWTIGVAAPEPKQGAQKDFDRWQAGQEGLKAGKDGAKREANPHAAGTEKYQAWDKKWQAGFQINQRKIAEKMARSTGTSASAAAKRAAAPEGNGATAH